MRRLRSSRQRWPKRSVQASRCCSIDPSRQRRRDPDRRHGYPSKQAEGPLWVDSGPLSIDSISPPSDPSRKSCLLASSRCPYLDIDLRTEAALHSEEATDGARWTILSCCCCPTRSLPRLDCRKVR